VKRTCVVELVIDEETERRLRQLCDLSSKLWNEVNYIRLRMWLEKKFIDFDGTYEEFYERYKPLIGAVTAQTIIRKNGNAWKTFFRLLELRREGRQAPRQPKGNLTAGIDIGINNLMAIYVENGLMKLINGRPLKSISYYWRKKIAEYQSMLNKYGLETSKRLRRMYARWRRQVRHYIDTKVREAVEWLYDVGVSKIKIGSPKGIAQENGNFNNNHVWAYGLLLRRIAEIAEEYGINVIYVDERGTSSKCPLHGDGCGIRIHRGLFKCMRLGKVFNADIVAARNILMAPVTPGPRRGVGGNGRRPGQGLNLQEEGCSSNLPTLSRGGGQFRLGMMTPRLTCFRT